MRRIVILAVVALIMALMMALPGPALADHGEPHFADHGTPLDERGNFLCAAAAVAIFIGLEREGPTPGETITTHCVPA